MKSWNAFRLVSIAALSFPFSVVAQPILNNPSFETNSTEGGTTYQTLYGGFSGLPGWSFSANPTTVLIGNPNDPYAYATPFGKWQIDLTGSDNVTGGWIETIITGLTPSSTYRLLFNLGTSTDWLGGVSTAPSIQVIASGNLAANFSHAPTTANERTSLVYSFTAPGSGSARIRFTNTSGNGIGFVAIDNLTLQADTPATLGLTYIDGKPQLNFTGELEVSRDLTNWTPQPEIRSPYSLVFTNSPQFFRTRKL